MEVIWTKKAYASFNSTIDFLLDIWTIEIATDFVDKVEHTIEIIDTHPEMFKVSEYDNKSWEAFIIIHITMFYRILEDKIENEYFWGNFDDPEKIKNLLKLK